MGIHWEEVIPIRIKKVKKSEKKCQNQIKNRFQFRAFQPFFNLFYFFFIKYLCEVARGFFERKAEQRGNVES